MTAAEGDGAASTATYLGRMEAFRERLLAIDARNPSICLRKTAQKTSFDLCAHPASAAVAPALLLRPAESLIIPDRDETQEAAVARVHLTALARNAEARAEETGLRELYLGLCWLEGNLTPETFVRGPTLLVPVRLEHRAKIAKAGWYLVPDTAPAVVNRALLAALKKHRAYAPPNETPDKLAEALAAPGDDPAGSPEALWREAALPAAPSEAPLAPLPPLTRADQDKRGPTPLKFMVHAVVGIFRQTGTALFADLEEMSNRAEQGDTDSGIVGRLIDAPLGDAPENPANYEVIRLDEVPDRRLNLVLQSDPSQDEVVVRAQKADCVVVQGPPGTGKSQTIVNLVADALSRRERVLVVCAKRAALDVVFQRLSQVGLGDGAYLVHDEATDRQAIYERMARAIARPAFGVEPTVAEHSRAVDRRIADIKTIVDALASEHRGVQVSALYKRAEPGFTPRLERELGCVTNDADLQRLLPVARQAFADHQRFDAPDRPTALRKSWATLTHGGHREILAALRAIKAACGEHPAPLHVASSARRLLLLSAADNVTRFSGRWFRHLLPGWHIAQATIRKVGEAEMRGRPVATWRPSIEAGDRLAACIAALESYMGTEWLAKASGLIGKPGALAALASTLLDAATQDFGAIQAHDAALAAASDFRPLLNECAKVLGGQHRWSSHIRQAVTLRWIEEVEAAHPSLRGNPQEHYEALRQELAAAMDAKRAALAKDLAADMRSRATAPVQGAPADKEGLKAATKLRETWAKLHHEVSKKRRHKPLRALLAEFGDPLRGVAPCWLASPEMVASIFPLERGLFDLAIFDEASQLAAERALSVVYRARRVVIAGDEQQMPPNDLFETSVEDAEEQDDAPAATEALRVDSLLLLAKRIFGQTQLLWHYRSEHSALIEFSVHGWYGGQLHLAPNVRRGEEAPPITWIPVKGRWEGKRNLDEAERAVEIMGDILRRSAEGHHATVGIVTFNIQQADAIRDEVDRRRKTDPDFNRHYALAEGAESLDARPIVKNLENIQGDERDIVIFSTGYAPGMDGVLRRQFGSLSREGGENRLNVSISRARRAAFVLCSFDPTTLGAATSKNLGPLRLQQYLTYARAVSDGDTAVVRQVLAELNPALLAKPAPKQLVFDSPFEEQVHASLVARGLLVDTQVGASGYRVDLAVVDPKNPGRYCLGIECDGAQFHSGRSVRERDIARQRFLEAKGWRMTRIWSRNWWMAPQRELARILALVQQAHTLSAPK